MAKSAVVGNLRVNLGLDSAEFQAGMARASKSMGALAKKAAVWGAAIGASMTAVAGAMSVAVGNVINKADSLGDVADRLGVTVEALQELRHAAERSGMGVQNFDLALRRFIRRASEAAEGTGAAKNAFAELGISLRDNEGRMKASEALLGEVADAMQKVPTQADRLRLAFQMFDTDGVAMLSVLEKGSAGLNQMREEARNLGIVLSEDAVRGAQAFKDNLETLDKAKQGIVMTLTAHLLPALELLSERLVALVNDGPKMQVFAEGVTSTFTWIARQAAHLVLMFDRLRVEIGGLIEAGLRLKNFDFSGAWEAFTAGQEASAKMRDDLNALLKDMTDGAIVSQGMIARRIAGAWGEPVAQIRGSFAQLQEDAKKAAEKLKEIQAEAARIFDATRTPLERYHIEIARLKELLDAGAISQDTFNRAVIQAQDAFAEGEKAANKANKVFENVSRRMSNMFASAFEGIIDGSRSVSDAISDLLKQFSRMLANAAFQKLFSAIIGGFTGGIGADPWAGLRIPGMATGGAVTGGRPYLIGEKGPELFVPSMSGHIVPNDELMAGRDEMDVRVTVGIDDEGKLRAFVDKQIGQYDKGAFARHVANQKKAQQRRFV